MGYLKDNNCTCNACGRRFSYGDKWSPMFNDVVWNQLVNYFGLEEHQVKAERKFNRLYNRWARAGYPYRESVDEMDGPTCHTYICYKCAENALGRKITREDLIGEDVPLNKEFEEFYFKD